ncbi:MAG: ribonuclease H-like domain-containing protein [Actinobacteria bacterium]|nr:ribonuclease H-like domain-containing protein [Actinomycetota bacterium]
MSIIDDLRRLGIYSEKLEERIESNKILKAEIELGNSDALDYEIVDYDAGRFKLYKADFLSEYLHGSFPLSSIFEMNPFEIYDFSRVLFLDSETTGLGGAGTVVFLIGILYFDGSKFILEQLLMRDYEDEIAMLEYFRELLSRFDVIVSFNGKCFDIPVIVDRYFYNRIVPLECERLEHIDLLNFSRMLWAGLIENCKLKTIERELLGFERNGDIDGWQVPCIYYDYLRSGDESRLKEVILHNRYDLLSLVSLLSRVSRLLNSPQEMDLSDFQRCLKIGRYYERRKKQEKCIDFYSWAFTTTSSLREKLQAACKCSLNLKRVGKNDEAVRYLERAIECGCEDAYLLQEISKYYEHKKKDYILALEYAVRGLGALDVSKRSAYSPTRADFIKRISRIERKIGKTDRKYRADDGGKNAGNRGQEGYSSCA